MSLDEDNERNLAEGTALQAGCARCYDAYRKGEINFESCPAYQEQVRMKVIDEMGLCPNFKILLEDVAKYQRGKKPVTLEVSIEILAKQGSITAPREAQE